MKSITELFIVLCLVAVTLTASLNEKSFKHSVNENELKQSHRDERLLFFIKILPEQCDTGRLDSVGATTLLGTCMDRKSCRKISGTPTSKCAKGLGTCCLDTATCNESTSRNNTYFVNPNYPNAWTTGGTCELTVNRVNNNICQIRIDFLSFNLAQPNIEGICDTDFMVVTPAGASNVPVLCGYNTGQHIYVDVDPQGGPLRILVDADTNAAFARMFNMQVAQIPCNSPSRAPTGCLQYFTSTSGNVMSFNFPADETTDQILAGIREPTTRQLSDTEYTVCVRPDQGFCGITWSPDPMFDPYSFIVSSDQNALGDDIFGNIQSVTPDGDCPEDFVIIPSAEWTDFEGNAVNNDRFCGPAFPPNGATSSLRPFNLNVQTDPDGETPIDSGNVGFSLDYRQQIC